MTTKDVSIHTRAMLVSLTISMWSARKYDRQITQKVNTEHHASSDAGRYNKHLLPGDAKSYKALVSLCGQIRAEHYAHTLAWSDEGWRVLPIANFDRYMEWLRDARAKLERAIDAFAADYPALRAEAKKNLNGMFNDADYPSTDDIRKRFGLQYSPMPLPAEGDVRLSLSADQVAMIERDVQAKVRSSIETAQRDAWQRLYDVAAAMQERLSDPENVFRDSLVQNTREVTDALKRLNVTNDPELERMRAEVETKLAKYDPKALRDFPNTRAKVARDASAIIEAMRANGMVA